MYPSRYALGSRSPIGIILLAATCFFCGLIWWDDTPVYTQSDPFQLFQLTYEQSGPASSRPMAFVKFNESVYFGLGGQPGGLWQTDGTAAGTVLVKDVQMHPSTLRMIDGQLYFRAQGEADPRRSALWQSDGTTAGTTEIVSGLQMYGDIVRLDEHLYFVVNDEVNGSEVWQSDGTADGTGILLDGVSGFGSTAPRQLTIANGQLYYLGEDDTRSGYRLWASDGTADGTAPVEGVPETIHTLIAFQDQLYFTATDGSRGYELWRYDGPPSTPTQIQVITEDFYLEEPAHFTIWQDQLYFSGGDELNGMVLWRSDGTDAGTEVVADLNPDLTTEEIQGITSTNDHLYLLTRSIADGINLYQSDGTAVGTQLLKQITVGSKMAINYFATLGDEVVFTIDNLDLVHDQTVDLWKSDGTTTGTARVTSLPIYSFATIDDAIYMGVDDVARGVELWRSDGTQAGTGYVTDLNPGYEAPRYLSSTVLGERLYTVAYRQGGEGIDTSQLWMSAGIATPATLLMERDDIELHLHVAGDVLFVHERDDVSSRLLSHSGGMDAPNVLQTFSALDLSLMKTVGDYLLFFEYNYPADLYTVWRSDGTATGTITLIGGLTDYPNRAIVVQDKLVWADGSSLWMSDGTIASTTSFAVPELADSGNRIGSLTAAETVFYFVGRQADGSQAWWRSDGTLAGTTRLSAASPSLGGSALATVGDALYIKMSRVNRINELWYADANATEIVQLIAQDPGPSRLPIQWPAVLNDQLYFLMADLVHGPELWTTDGTVDGTMLVKDIVPAELDGLYFAYPGPFWTFQDQLIFGADNGVTGRELWRSDGTAAGTTLLRDINPGPGSSGIRQSVVQGDIAYFVAHDGAHGAELWQTDGTAAGTMLVKDFYAGSASSYPAPFHVTNNSLYILADNGQSGRQIYNLYTGTPLALPPAVEPLYQLYLPLVE